MACTNADTITAALTEAASGPAEVSGDAGTVRQQPLRDLIAAANYAAARCASTSKRRGLRFTRLVPPGGN